jgi:GT2 family glycosyltransferase
LRKLGTDRFLFIENNQEGLSTCYNRILDERAGRDEILIFAHDDITISDLFFQEKIIKAFDQQQYAIAGLAGTSDFGIPPDLIVTSWLQPPREACSGRVEHHVPGSSSMTLMMVYGPTPRRCVVLDGLFLAIDLKKIGHIRFEEQLAFHFYDLDFCLTAHQAGLILGTVNVYVTHKSGGNYTSQAFREAQAKFGAKWKAGRYRIHPPESIQGHLAANLAMDRHIMPKAGTRSPQANPRQGRNELCHCGSGRKYKHCHGKTG